MRRFGGESLFERFVRVIKANVNSLLQSLEDPEMVLNQSLDEMQIDLINVRQAYAEVLATQRRQRSRMEQAINLADEWYQRASLAVEKGDDALAEEALRRRQTSLDKAGDVKAGLDALQDNVDKLFESVRALEEKIIMARDEKEQLIARARTAKTTSKVNEMLSDVAATGSAGAFDRMKDKVEILETRAEVSQGLLPQASQRSGLEDRFKALEGSGAIDEELARLKGARSLPA